MAVGAWRGCSERSGRPLELERAGGGATGGRYVDHIRLAGRFAGYAVTEWDKYESDTTLTVVDLVSGARASYGVGGRLPGSLTGFADLAINRRGDAAWIYGGLRDRRREWGIYVLSDGASARRYRTRHALTRLRLGTRRVRWRERGRRRSLGLAHEP